MPTALAKLTVAKLRAALKKKGMATSGRKAELMARLGGAEDGGPAAAPSQKGAKGAKGTKGKQAPAPAAPAPAAPARAAPAPAAPAPVEKASAPAAVHAGVAGKHAAAAVKNVFPAKKVVS